VGNKYADAIDVISAEIRKVDPSLLPVFTLLLAELDRGRKGLK
jgi:hypothetical protein